jgi:hypothetical protein
MKPKSSEQIKAEYQHTLRLAEEKRGLRDAAKKAHEEAQEAVDATEAKGAQLATELFKAIGAEALEAHADSEAPSPQNLDMPIPAPIRASALKRGESIRLAPGQSIVFEGGAEISFQGGRFLTNAEVARIMQAVRDAKGGSSEPPPSGL